MAVSLDDVSVCSDRQAKKHKTEDDHQINHPLGILPLGNSYFDPLGNSKRNEGLGSLAKFDDDMILEISSFLAGADCLKVESSSKAVYAFFNDEGAWRDRCLDEQISSFKGTWKRSWIDHHHNRGIYSDTLFYPIQCRRYFKDIKKKYGSPNFEGNVPKHHISELTRDSYIRDFEKKGMPVIIKGIVETWPANSKWKSRDYFMEKCGVHKVACGTALWTIKEYYDYADNNKLDEVPFFVFENKFFADISDMVNDFRHPQEIFGSSMFDLLDPPYRPDNRWLLIGSSASFSQWHIDPNSTTAWNGVIQGRKLWLLLPPACVPEGVFPSKDGSAVKQPHSLLEWFGSGLYAETKSKYGKKLFEVVCGPGEMVVVPRGWWHCVVNLDDDTVAVTQNFCSETHLHSVRRFLKEKRNCVSGIENEYRDQLWKEFDKVLVTKRPDLVDPAAIEEMLKAEDDKEASLQLSGKSTSPQSAIYSTVHSQEETKEDDCDDQCSSGFSFWSHLRTSKTPLTFAKPQ